MMAAVIDTNVLVTANKATDNCALVCIGTLREARSGLVILDEGFLILKEYKGNVNESGRPGAGDEFLLWLLRNITNAERVASVHITPTDEKGFEEFPDDPALAKFDHSDRKFVAVALASKHQPEIANATDTDWWHFREPLASNGVKVRFLCPEEMLQAQVQKKRGKRTK